MKVIFLDVDGTLIDYRCIIPQSARDAINEARAKGNKVYLCTGCSLKEIEVRNLGVEYDGNICGNGCYIDTDGKVLYHRPLTLEECTHFVDWCKERDMAFRLECNSGMYLSDDYPEKALLANVRYRRGKDAQLLPTDKPTIHPGCYIHENLYRDDCNKTAFVLRSYQDYLDAKEEFKGLQVGTWGGVGEAALYGDVSAVVTKASAIKQLLEYLGVDAKDTYAFGDARSDIPMFEVCGTAVSMGNGGPECKAAADYITDDVNENGLYNAFKHFDLI
ncbi:MAG: Cof-type HAD-IIB family hydrolase [Bacillota bacterium]|nr:Cof-type HAD-IIB family hydrolase [Bacillota bacterium]